GEGLVGFEGRSDRLALGEDPQGVDRPIPGPVHELGQIAAVVAVPGLDRQVPVHRRAYRERGERRRIDADDREGAGLGQALDAPGEDLGWRVTGIPLLGERTALSLD